ncbi:transposase [Peribacillus sp. TH24]|nr:transposase [Peribacillus sp. TH24]MBK5460311.1 transposase [Peribacillus sp. TH27]MBK5498485.1 transposase [Peribacillus sp. TH14]
MFASLFTGTLHMEGTGKKGRLDLFLLYSLHPYLVGVGKDHIHLLLSCSSSLAPSKIMQYLKGRSSRILQDQFPELKKKYWGTTFMGKRLFLSHSRNDDRRNN